jgi:hypothetical protein
MKGEITWRPEESNPVPVLQCFLMVYALATQSLKLATIEEHGTKESQIIKCINYGAVDYFAREVSTEKVK